MAPKKSYIMVADSPAAKREWLQLFQRCLSGEFDPTKMVLLREGSSSSEPPSYPPPTPGDVNKDADGGDKEIEQKIIQSHLEVYKFGGFDFTSLITGEEDKEFLEVIEAARADSVNEIVSAGGNSDDEEEETTEESKVAETEAPAQE